MNTHLNYTYAIRLFKLDSESAVNEYNSFLKQNNSLQIVDEMYSQLIDVIKIRHPHLQLTTAEIDEKIQQHLGTKSIQEYGVWVYYPWRNVVVHLLDKKEFIEVKTNRNKNKITQAEQDVLINKSVGIIGLSVGQSVATTIAMERICGQMRLADFDNLELSNFNRIRTGVFNLNLPKVIVTAREVLEIDPYIDVICFTDGITEENIDRFITENGKLDIIIEECDSLEIKILSRIKAKQYHVPLVMEMSDRGMMDIERYDLNPDYEMFQGAINHLDLSLEKLKNLSIHGKIEYMYPMVGADLISDRLKQSVQEVGKTISTWPQLASAVVLGGGICADVVRRIFLNQLSVSGRFYVDMEQLISD